jgi:hypothetical protein
MAVTIANLEFFPSQNPAALTIPTYLLGTTTTGNPPVLLMDMVVDANINFISIPMPYKRWARIFDSSVVADMNSHVLTIFAWDDGFNVSSTSTTFQVATVDN